MDVLQPHHRDIPEQKDEKEEDQTGENQEPDEDSLLGFNLQKPLQSIAECDTPFPTIPPRGEGEGGGI